MLAVGDKLVQDRASGVWRLGSFPNQLVGGFEGGVLSTRPVAKNPSAGARLLVDSDANAKARMMIHHSKARISQSLGRKLGGEGISCLTEEPSLATAGFETSVLSGLV